MREPTAPETSDVEWHNWTGDESCRPREIVHPRSTEEIAAAVAAAGRAGMRVRVAGAGHSFTDIACSEGMLIVLDRCQDVLEVDRASGLVRVQAGISIARLNAALAGHGLALENLGDIDAQSIAGAISTATHGTGARLGNIPSQVAAMTLVLADGSTFACSEQSEPESFLAARVGLGALGVLAEVTLRCVPAFTLCGIDAPAPLDETLARFEELALTNDHFEFYVFPHCDIALTRTNNRTERSPEPRGKVAEYANDVLLTNRTFEMFCRIGRRLPNRIPEINRIVTRLAGKSKRVDRSDRIFASPRLVKFTEMEYALPRAHTTEAVRRVLEDDRARWLRGAVPDRGAHSRSRRGAAEHRSGERERLCGRAHVPRDALAPLLRGGRADHARTRRTSPLGQASLPDRGYVARALSGLGSLPGGARAA